MPSTLTCCRMVFPPSTSWPLPPAARIVAAFLHRARELLRDQRQFLVILDGVDDTVELDPVLWALRGAVPHRGAGGSVGCLHSSMQSLLWVLTSWDSSTTVLSLATLLLLVCCSVECTYLAVDPLDGKCCHPTIQRQHIGNVKNIFASVGWTHVHYVHRTPSPLSI